MKALSSRPYWFSFCPQPVGPGKIDRGNFSRPYKFYFCPQHVGPGRIDRGNSLQALQVLFLTLTCRARQDSCSIFPLHLIGSVFCAERVFSFKNTLNWFASIFKVKSCFVDNKWNLFTFSLNCDVLLTILVINNCFHSLYCDSLAHYTALHKC
jgi:hypothetical protein